ncbi:HlyD family secretion protein [Fischerella major NIES-592]|uniref:HlyD family secretion protein n=1 Tax=Fischerella major NIES-592 TaxID=210994 RepID=A0A1U7GSX2_9CYAN|nr:HlyD family efflux transporter periplasmic adaptor subunit [Fischerella major]OKH10947.1 HlyD family secretion protein [Fischerella major NIES-592]
MPHPYTNSSSALADERDEKQSNSQTQDFTTVKEQTQDWHYGTEELLDALPRIWTRGVLYALLGFTALALPWSVLAKVDETGNARGRIEPQGSTQKLDALVSGSVKAVKVKEGDTVQAGQILLELDSDILQTELHQAQEKLTGLLNQRLQYDVIKNQLQSALSVQKQQNQSQALEKLSQVHQAKQDLEAKQGLYNLQKLEKQALLNQAQQQIHTSHNDLKSAQGRLSIDSRIVDRFSKLLRDGAVSITQIDQLKKEQQESKQLYQKAQSDIKQAQLRFAEEQSRYQATINQLESEIEQAKLKLQQEQSNYQSLLQAGKLAILNNEQQLKDLQTQITTLESQIAQAKSQVTSLGLQLQQRIVRSPINGTIFELPVSKPGAVVQLGQRVAQIAPKNTPLIIKAQMPSQQSGFLKVGMPVKIKFDAYPFQEYGIAQGKVTWISPDSKVSQTPQGQQESFELNIALNQQYLQNGNQRILLNPGQTATAEVIIRQRRVIDFVLDPFQRLRKDGLKL